MPPTDPSTQPSSEPSTTNQLQVRHQIHLRIYDVLADEFDNTTMTTTSIQSDYCNSALANHDESSGKYRRVHGSNKWGHKLIHSEHNASSCSQFKCTTRCKWQRRRRRWHTTTASSNATKYTIRTICTRFTYHYNYHCCSFSPAHAWQLQQPTHEHGEYRDGYDPFGFYSSQNPDEKWN